MLSIVAQRTLFVVVGVPTGYFVTSSMISKKPSQPIQDGSASRPKFPSVERSNGGV
ncbi:hypothetical protein PCANC_11413 [Puccinia coronata f. sp. avenae]|uniref:Uncharacterized protein n=1 Tax=Puccinia coronata f. sp. avenae TaxID=200324 RepID=A0A2N5SNJ1_9BASI|nr:hypothetical protein PCANC_18184 [Puccinia coronata f. sp. avenae]PLW51171.1 hypothetical protein PCANC_11413 [Puccinia coronata f. sp. avenae]